MTEAEALVLHFINLAEQCESAPYCQHLPMQLSEAKRRVERQGLGYQERLIARIIRWIAEAYTPEQIQAEIADAHAAAIAAHRSQLSVGKNFSDASQKAANTAALIAAIKAGAGQ